MKLKVNIKKIGKSKHQVQEAVYEIPGHPGNVRELENVIHRLVISCKDIIISGEIVDDILQTAQEIRKKFKAFVILGIGGSALGPIAVQQALNHLHYNELPDEKRGGPRLYVEDNVDPERMEALLDVIDLESTCFNVITKSGSTSETMTQYLIIWELLKTRLEKTPRAIL